MLAVQQTHGEVNQEKKKLTEQKTTLNIDKFKHKDIIKNYKFENFNEMAKFL